MNLCCWLEGRERLSYYFIFAVLVAQRVISWIARTRPDELSLRQVVLLWLHLLLSLFPWAFPMSKPSEATEARTMSTPKRKATPLDTLPPICAGAVVTSIAPLQMESILNYCGSWSMGLVAAYLLLPFIILSQIWFSFGLERVLFGRTRRAAAMSPKVFQGSSICLEGSPRKDGPYDSSPPPQAMYPVDVVRAICSLPK